MDIILATHNVGKFEELNMLLGVEGISFLPLSDFDTKEIEETGETFIENAILKAHTVAMATGLPAIADDSGLEIYALNGFPGLHSARCAGDGVSDEAKVYYVLGKMDGIKDRRARFVSAVALVKAEHPNLPTFFTGYCEGDLLTAPRGKASPGLQYDSIFLHPEFNKTLAEVSKEEKNKVSHRFHATRSMKAYLKTMVEYGPYNVT